MACEPIAFGSAGSGVGSAASTLNDRTSAAVATARAHGMLVMAGCMIETSLGITAAAHFAPLLDCADLDGAALLADDPHVGATIDNGRIKIPDRPGLGVTSR